MKGKGGKEMKRKKKIKKKKERTKKKIWNSTPASLARAYP